MIDMLTGTNEIEACGEELHGENGNLKRKGISEMKAILLWLGFFICLAFGSVLGHHAIYEKDIGLGVGSAIFLMCAYVLMVTFVRACRRKLK